jgi:hypothetical protein
MMASLDVWRSTREFEQEASCPADACLPCTACRSVLGVWHKSLSMSQTVDVLAFVGRCIHGVSNNNNLSLHGAAAVQG